MQEVDEWLAAAGLSIHTDHVNIPSQASKKAKSGKRQGLGHDNSVATACSSSSTQTGTATAQAVHGADALLQALKRGKKSSREEHSTSSGGHGRLDADDSRAAAVMSRPGARPAPPTHLSKQGGTHNNVARQEPAQHVQKKAKVHSG